MNLNVWRAVPDNVARMVPAAVGLKTAHNIAAHNTVHQTATVTVTWQPADKTVSIYGADVSPAAQEKYANAYHQLFPSMRVLFDPPRALDYEHDVIIKRAYIPMLTPLLDNTQKILGGPTPLTNALVTGAMAGGLGYGAGTLAENLFPERYVQRGRLRKTLGMLGLLSGAGFGTLNAYSNARATTPHDEFWRAPVFHTIRGFGIRNDMPPVAAQAKQANFGFADDNDDFNASGVFDVPEHLHQPVIPVAHFNQAIWRDTALGAVNGFNNHTPPAYAAATTGLMTGISSGKRSPIISPADVIHGIASAGVGLATANIAGRALSAMAGLTPAGQEKLQDMGLWGGMMHAIAPAILGIH